VWKFRKNLFKDVKTYLGEKKIKLQAKDVVPNINPTQPKTPLFVHGDVDL